MEILKAMIEIWCIQNDLILECISMEETCTQMTLTEIS